MNTSQMHNYSSIFERSKFPWTTFGVNSTGRVWWKNRKCSMRLIQSVYDSIEIFEKSKEWSWCRLGNKNRMNSRKIVALVSNSTREFLHKYIFYGWTKAGWQFHAIQSYSVENSNIFEHSSWAEENDLSGLSK